MFFLLLIPSIILILVVNLIVVIVPEQQAFIIERVGRYNRVLMPGIHFKIPIIEAVRYKHSLKEKVISIPGQTCITQDNVSVVMDGVLYMSIFDAVKASYAIDNYEIAAESLAQTTMRAEIGKIELDRAFSGRNDLNRNIIIKLDEITEAWGVKVNRYEILNIIPPTSVVDSMEKQVYSERKKRAEILLSEGERESQINLAEGEKQTFINISEGEKIKRINEAEGKAKSLEIIADSIKDGLSQISSVLEHPKSYEAIKYNIVSLYLEPLGKILKNSEVSILPKDLANIRGIIESLNLKDFQKNNGDNL